MAGEIRRRLQDLNAKFQDQAVADVGFEAFRSNTPVRTGNARRRTRLTGTEIRADYAYAQRLDQGYSSQSPQGMTQPAIEAMQQYIKQTGK
jgi:uncharacterized protein YbjT (DUF2867 family)